MTKHKSLKKKKHAQNLHFKKRLEERYNIILNRQDRLDIVNLIQTANHNFYFIERETTRLRWWLVFYKGVLFPVVYDNIRHTLVTTLKWAWIPLEKRIKALSYYRKLNFEENVLKDLALSIENKEEELFRLVSNKYSTEEESY